MKAQYKEPTLAIDIIVRVFGVSLMWWNLTIGYLIIGLVDAIDGDILARVGVSRKWYQGYDKLLDYWWYIAIFVYMVTNLPVNTMWWILFASFIIRSIGIILYTLTRKEWLLFAYPGLFNWLFFFYVSFPILFDIYPFGPYLMIFILVVFTYWREWALHVDKVDMTNFLFPWIQPKRW